MRWKVFLTLAVIGLCCQATWGQELRQAVAIKVELNGEKAAVTVSPYQYGKAGDPATFVGVGFFKYDIRVDKGPTRVGWKGDEKDRKTVVLRGERYSYVPSLTSRHENGTIGVAQTKGGKLRLTGVYAAHDLLFVFDEEVSSGDSLLLEEQNKKK